MKAVEPLNYQERTKKNQLAPPDVHKQHAHERDIRIWKNHLVSCISVTDKMYPMHLWYRLLEQTEITLNMLMPSRKTPNILVHIIMEGNFDFKKTPLAPTSTNVIVCDKPNIRRTCGQHMVQECYKGPKVEQRQCHKVYISNTRFFFSPIHC